MNKHTQRSYLLSAQKPTGMNNESPLLNNKCLHACTVQLRLFGLRGKFHYTNSLAVHADVKDVHALFTGAATSVSAKANKLQS